ncbi:MAG: hypothetical protein KF874_00340 [Rhizobiaceae bacterium]|nr:hypothetical protein [Rhizobiaceae bacterium]
MRLFSLLLILAGVALAGAYPWYQNNFSGRELGSVTVFQRPGQFRSITVPLRQSDEPVRVLVDLTTRVPANFSGNVAILTLKASTGGKIVLTDTLSFSNSVQRDQSPQQALSIFRGEAGLISPVENADYTFVVTPNESGGTNYSKVELVLRANVGSLDSRAQPVGFALGGIGILGLILASRRKRRNRGEQPPAPPKWGRGGST